MGLHELQKTILELMFDKTLMTTLKTGSKISIFFTNVAIYITRKDILPELITTWKTISHQKNKER